MKDRIFNSFSEISKEIFVVVSNDLGELVMEYSLISPLRYIESN